RIGLLRFVGALDGNSANREFRVICRREPSRALACVVRGLINPENSLESVHLPSKRRCVSLAFTPLLSRRESSVVCPSAVKGFVQLGALLLSITFARTDARG